MGDDIGIIWFDFTRGGDHGGCVGVGVGGVMWTVDVLLGNSVMSQLNGRHAHAQHRRRDQQFHDSALFDNAAMIIYIVGKCCLLFYDDAISWYKNI
mmetsp:Transcript_29361/g.63205  ORF Transcript_29361/g.63205 Transcript_29361/m.63205 type:complete len:96 (+) Transcript_29361:21-308(+)